MRVALRRHLRFSLRTLFVVLTIVALAAAWLRWNAIQVQQRREFVAYLQNLDQQPDPVTTWVLHWDHDERRIPLVWRLMGATNEDWGTWLLCNQALTDEQLQRAKRLLPDCQVEIYRQ
jgi:hypothetical protein